MLALRFILDRHVINGVASHCNGTNSFVDGRVGWGGGYVAYFISEHLDMGGDAIWGVFGEVERVRKKKKELSLSL